MEKIFNTLKERDFVIYNNFKIEYVKIAEFKKISVILGIALDYLVILDEQKNVFLVGQKSKNFLPLFKVLELDFEEFKSSFIYDEVQIAKVFPLKEITTAVFESESSYWVEKCLYYLKNMGIIDNDLLLFLKAHKNEKWLGQKNRQKILELIKG